jgi:hypothetical protein
MMTAQLNRDDLKLGISIAEQIDGLILYPHLLGLLAEGEPVTLDQIAAASSRQIADVAALLRQHPGAEWDEQGRLVAFRPLTLRPTGQWFTFGGRTAYGHALAACWPSRSWSANPGPSGRGARPPGSP